MYYIAAFTGPARGTADYSLDFVLPGPIKKDQYSSQPGGNATFQTAAKLIPPNSTSDMQNGQEQYVGSPNPLSIDTTAGDWYQFQIGAGATSGDFARIDFNAQDGQLFLGLASAGQQILGLSTTLGNTEEVSLGLLPAGTYFLYVAGANGATNPSYVLTINAPAAAPVPDYYDRQPGGNNTSATASDLNSIVGAGESTVSQLTITPADIDWYEFSTSGPLTSSNYVGLDFDPSEGLIDAEVLDSSGNVIGRADDAAYFSSDLGVEARMSLPTEAGNGPYTFHVVVYGLQGATSPGYALHFFLPGTNSPNDTMSKATDLGNLTGINTISAPTYPLAILSSSDKNYFQFTLQDTPVTGDYVTITSVNGVGALELDLVDANNDLIATADTTQGFAQISLYGNKLPITAGTTYYVRVEGYRQGTTPSYTLQINAPGGDRFEPDDTQQAARDLDSMPVGGIGGGYVQGLASWDDLSIEPDPPSSSDSEYNNNAPPAADVDWYSFTLYTEGLAGDYARIDYDLSLGDLVLGLYDMRRHPDHPGLDRPGLRADLPAGAREGTDLLSGGQRLQRGHESRLHAHARNPRGARAGHRRDRSRRQHAGDRRQPRDHPGPTNHRRPGPSAIDRPHRRR